MARNYTLEDVEVLRNKSGISYEDAVALLDKYDGDLARALIELEKLGQLDSTSKDSKINMEDILNRIKWLWNKGLSTRIIVMRKDTQLINLSVSFLILMLLLGAYAVIAALILSLISGCNISVKTDSNKVAQNEEAVQETIKPDEFIYAPVDNDDDSDGYHNITIS